MHLQLMWLTKKIFLVKFIPKTFIALEVHKLYS